MERIRSAALGGDIDSYCGRCKLELNHRVTAMVEGRVKRVQCLTCNSEHAFHGRRRAAAGTATSASPAQKRTPPARKPKRSALEDAVGAPRPYAITSSYAKGDLLFHTQYGRGLVLAVRGDKIDVEFTTGPRLMMHSRRSDA